MLKASEHGSTATGLDVAYALVAITALSIATYLTHLVLDRLQLVKALRYGWLAEFVELAAPEGRFSTAFVLTSVSNDGSHLGYEGLIENIAINSDREITSITLLDANRFVVHLKSDGVDRFDVDRSPIDRIFIERANIKNVALTVYEKAQADEQSAAK